MPPTRYTPSYGPLSAVTASRTGRSDSSARSSAMTASARMGRRLERSRPPRSRRAPRTGGPRSRRSSAPAAARRRGARRPRSSRRSRRGRRGRPSSSRAGRGRSPPPRGSRARLAKTCSVCSPIVPPDSSFAPGFSASWPETNTKPPATIAWEYGAPWNGAGAASVRTTLLSPSELLSRGTARLRERDAERLEDRLEDVLGVAPLDQAHVQGQARRPRPAPAGSGRRGRCRGRRRARPRGRRSRTRAAASDVSSTTCASASSAAIASRAEPAGTVRAQRRRERLAERTARGRDLRVRAARSVLEGQVEARVERELPEQVVEHRQSRRDRRAPAPAHDDADTGCCHAAAQRIRVGLRAHMRCKDGPFGRSPLPPARPTGQRKGRYW